jgi:hypothetical protein
VPLEAEAVGAVVRLVPRSRNVVNGLDPPGPNNDEELADAECIVLEKDFFVNPSRIFAICC